MSSKTVNIKFNSANLLWLQAQKVSSGSQSLSKILNEVLDKIRTGGQLGEVRSVRGTARLGGEPELEKAHGAVQQLFQHSLERTSKALVESDEAEA